MAIEIERKFLVKSVPIDIDQFPHKEILQWYFNDPSNGKSVRVRHIWEIFTVTRKKGNGLVREELEAKITKEEFDQLRFQVENHFLEKTRYYIPYQSAIIELDIYKNLQWFKVVEVEFANKREAKNFVIPQRFGEEITRMREASNVYIANHGLSEQFIPLV